MESILTSVKKLNNVPEECESFDTDFIIHINTVLMDLREMGVGPSAGFMIFDKTATWADFVHDITKVVAVQTYIGLRVKLLFDPPSSSSLIDAINRQIEKCEWMINHAAEQGPTEDSLIIAELMDKNTALESINNEIVSLIDESGYVETSGTVIEKLAKILEYAKAQVDVQYNVDVSGRLAKNSTSNGAFADIWWRKVPKINCEKVTSFNKAFYTNKNLLEVEFENTQNVTLWTMAFFNCTALTKIKTLNLEKGANLINLFNGCTALVELGVEGNILNSITIPSSVLSLESAKGVLLALKNFTGHDEFSQTVTLSGEVWALLDADGATAPGDVTWADYVTNKCWNK